MSLESSSGPNETGELNTGEGELGNDLQSPETAVPVDVGELAVEQAPTQETEVSQDMQEAWEENQRRLRTKGAPGSWIVTQSEAGQSQGAWEGAKNIHNKGEIDYAKAEANLAKKRTKVTRKRRSPDASLGKPSRPRKGGVSTVATEEEAESPAVMPEQQGTQAEAHEDAPQEVASAPVEALATASETASQKNERPEEAQQAATTQEAPSSKNVTGSGREQSLDERLQDSWNAFAPFFAERNAREAERKKGFFARIFGSKKTAEDTVFASAPVKKASEAVTSATQNEAPEKSDGEQKEAPAAPLKEKVERPAEKNLAEALISFDDVQIPEDQKEALLADPDQVALRRETIPLLERVIEDYGQEKVVSVGKKMVEASIDSLKQYGIDPTPLTYGRSWAIMEIARHSGAFAVGGGKEKMGAHPIEDDTLQEKIIAFRIGLEANLAFKSPDNAQFLGKLEKGLDRKTKEAILSLLKGDSRKNFVAIGEILYKRSSTPRESELVPEQEVVAPKRQAMPATETAPSGAIPPGGVPPRGRESLGKNTLAIAEEFFSFQDAPISSDMKQTLREGIGSEDNLNYASALNEMFQVYGKDEVIRRADAARSECNKEIHFFGLPASPLTESRSWGIKDLAKEYYMFTHPKAIKSMQALANPMESTEAQDHIINKHLGIVAYESVISRRDFGFLRNISNESQRGEVTVLLQDLIKKGEMVSTADYIHLGEKLRTAHSDSKSSLPPDAPPASDSALAAQMEVPTDASEGKKDKEYSLKEVSEQFLGYQDSAITKKEKRKMLKDEALAGKREKYGEALIEMFNQHGESKVQEVANSIQRRFWDALRKLEIHPSPYAMSNSWSMWDMAKQYYFNTHKELADEAYEIADPMTSDAKQEEIVSRNLAWEVYKSEDRDFLNKGTDPALRKEIEEMLALPPKDNGELSASVLAELGAKLRRFISGEGYGKAGVEKEDKTLTASELEELSALIRKDSREKQPAPAPAEFKRGAKAKKSRSV